MFLSTFLFDQLVTVIFDSVCIYSQYSNETSFIQNNTHSDMWKFLDAINYWGADKSLARQGTKQATATKL